MPDIRIRKIADDVIIPTQAHETDAGFDLYSYCPEDYFYTWESGFQQRKNGIKIRPNETRVIHTGIYMAIPKGYWGGIYARSGIATKQGLRPANCVGVIDSSYRGEILVALHNDSCETQLIENGQRIAQFILHKCEPVVFHEVECLDETDRSDGGFGSSGK